MRRRAEAWILCAAAVLSACHARRDTESAVRLTVAAAANLTDILGEVGRAYKTKTGVDVTFSYGSTIQLAQQIEHGAPFDVFAAADTEHVDSLVQAGKLVPDSRAVYAVGQLALWTPKGMTSGIRELKDLTQQQVRFVAVAQPELAPYGRATIDLLQSKHLWSELQPKIVYASNISQAKQMAASGSADAAFTAYSLVLHEGGTVLNIDRRLYHPIEQALAVVTDSPHKEEAERFRLFLLGEEGRAILARGGYSLP